MSCEWASRMISRTKQVSKHGWMNTQSSIRSESVQLAAKIFTCLCTITDNFLVIHQRCWLSSSHENVVFRSHISLSNALCRSIVRFSSTFPGFSHASLIGCADRLKLIEFLNWAGNGLQKRSGRAATHSRRDATGGSECRRNCVGDSYSNTAR